MRNVLSFYKNVGWKNKDQITYDSDYSRIIGNILQTMLVCAEREYRNIFQKKVTIF